MDTQSITHRISKCLTAAASNEDIAVSLATLLRSARAVISKNQKHINDPKVGNKGITADFVEKT